MAMMAGARSVPALFWSRVDQWADRTAMREKDLGVWRDISWREYGAHARQVALGLVSLGLERGDRVAIIGENTPEWLYTDLGVQSAGGISVGIYTTDAPKQVAYVMAHSGARFYFAEDEEQLDKILEVRHDLPGLVKIVVFDTEGLRHFHDPMVLSFEQLLALGAAFEPTGAGLLDQRLAALAPEDVTVLIYTSGTTGPPKGAMITHANVLAVLEMQDAVNPLHDTDEALSFLPLCHIAERIFSVFTPLKSGHVVNFAESSETVPENIREVSPTIFFAVPRIWEKFYSAVILRVQDSTALEKLAFRWALALGRTVSEHTLANRRAPWPARALFAVADWAVLRNVKRFIGLDRARYLLSGAAPISPDLLRFYHALGLDMREVYGQTECCGPTTVHYPGDIRLGTVGRPLPRAEVRVAADGEILVRGPHVFAGYYHDPAKTAETLADGWLHTGDVGRMDEDGHVRILDRKKDIIITSGGKNITPSEIENQLKFSPYVNDAVVIGDGRKYLTALIMIDEENVAKYAQDHRVPFTTFASLTRAPEIVTLIGGEVEAVNKQFARVETVKQFRLIDIKLTTDDEEITPTMKLKRKYVSQKFKDLIEAMYHEAGQGGRA
jgi:long-chain acyl-CoA synthetase